MMSPCGTALSNRLWDRLIVVVKGRVGVGVRVSGAKKSRSFAEASVHGEKVRGESHKACSPMHDINYKIRVRQFIHSGT